MDKNKKVWSKKEVKRFISKYKRQRLLWDPKALNCRNKIEKRIAQNKLAEDFNTTVSEINKKVYILRTQFFYEHKRMMMNRDQSTGIEGYVSKWEHYRALKFLLCEDVSDDDSLLSEDDDDEKCDHQDEYQMFGNYVASELRSMHFEKNISELKKLIQQQIVRLTEEDDKEYYSF